MSRHLYSPLAIAMALLFVMLAPAVAGDYEDAVQLLREGKSDAAMKKVDAALAANKDDARSRFLKGLILTEQNNTAAAIKVFNDLTRDYPELPEPYNNLAVLYAAQGKYDLAREALEMAIRTHPSYAVAHENLGDVYAKMASEAYDKALSLDRSNQTAKTKLSLIGELFTSARPQRPIAPAPAASPKPSPAAAKPPAAAQEPPQAAPASQAAIEDQPAVMAAVNGWAKAWSDKDVAAYLSHYAPSFTPPGGQSRADWEKLRRNRLSRPKFIKVSASQAVVSFLTPSKATVRFRQQYKSDTIDSTGFKTLTMVKSGDRWLIEKELFEN